MHLDLDLLWNSEVVTCFSTDAQTFGWLKTLSLFLPLSYFSLFICLPHFFSLELDVFPLTSTPSSCSLMMTFTFLFLTMQVTYTNYEIFFFKLPSGAYICMSYAHLICIHSTEIYSDRIRYDKWAILELDITPRQSEIDLQWVTRSREATFFPLFF